jgi:hypothetical protein
MHAADLIVSAFFEWHCFGGNTGTKPKVMADRNNNKTQENETAQGNTQNIGIKQGTAQTGAQNSGGENRDEQADQYTEDLNRSGNRPSSNTKEE